MTPPSVPRRSAWFFEWFRKYARTDLRKHFHAVRLAGPVPPPDIPGPVVIVVSHASIWDMMLGAELSKLFPGRGHFVPIDAKALQRYRFFERVGAFGIDLDSLRGAATFLRTARAILSDEKNVLWVTAQGRFRDVRTRPLGLRPGVGHLAAELPRGTLLTLALEYPFWSERTPEALVRFGPPVPLTQRSPREWTAELERALTATMDELSADAQSQDARRFRTLFTGKAGIGGVYDLWRRGRAWLRGERFTPEHGS